MSVGLSTEAAALNAAAEQLTVKPNIDQPSEVQDEPPKSRKDGKKKEVVVVETGSWWHVTMAWWQLLILALLLIGLSGFGGFAISHWWVKAPSQESSQPTVGTETPPDTSDIDARYEKLREPLKDPKAK